jgi:peptidoglycan/LPS O-acetylase OafA/YrhL
VIACVHGSRGTNAAIYWTAVAVIALLLGALLVVTAKAWRWRSPRRGTFSWRRRLLYGAVTICLCALIIVLPLWTGLSPFLVFVVAWAILLIMLMLPPKEA